MEKFKSFKDLIVWQKAMKLAWIVYTITKNFPKEEIFGLTSQLRRSAISIPCNIAEGHARNSSGEFKQFLGVSKGSLAELETLLIISHDLNLVSFKESDELISKIDEVGKLLNGLLNSLKRRAQIIK